MEIRTLFEIFCKGSFYSTNPNKPAFTNIFYFRLKVKILRPVLPYCCKILQCLIYAKLGNNS